MSHGRVTALRGSGRDLERGPPVELNKDNLECSALSEPFLPARTAYPPVSEETRFA